MLGIIRKGDNNARQLLLSLGMGNYNATLAIRYMFIAPATTDPAMPAVILMTKHLQQGLRAAGAEISVTGQIDEATSAVLEKLLGPSWSSLSWYTIFTSVIAAKRQRVLEDRSTALDLGDISLPTLPGGTITWVIGAAAAYYFLVHKKGR